MAENAQNLVKVNFGDHVVDLVLRDKLGEGAFASVYKAFDDRGHCFAVKVVKFLSQVGQDSVSEEIGVLLRIQHPNIIKLYALDFIAGGEAAVLVMELCEKGTLNGRLDDPIRDPTLSLRWMCQLANALEYLHSHNIVHRDLKPENILVNAGDDLKISDFGVARSFVCMHGGSSVLEEAGGYLSHYLHAYMGTFAGTPYWIAPEVFDHVYNEKADIFSLGIIFYAICERQSCVHDGKRYYGCFVKDGLQDVGIGVKMYEMREEILPQFSLEFEITKRVTHLICAMLSYDFRGRPDALEICSQLNEVGNNDLLYKAEVNNADPGCVERCRGY